jgi:hypothetical protein
VPNDKDKRGRVTPKKGTPPPSSSGASPSGARRGLPGRIGPFERPDPDKPLGQVGKRPSSPLKLFAFFLVYFVCGIIAFFVLKGGLRVILGILFIGISLFWLRGAATATVRLQRLRDGKDD